MPFSTGCNGGASTLYIGRRRLLPYLRLSRRLLETSLQVRALPDFVRGDDVVVFDGNLQKWRGQLEKLKVEVDQAFEIVDEGLISFGLEGFNLLN